MDSINIKDLHVTISHGNGTGKTGELINGLFFKYFANPALNKADDAAEIMCGGQKLAFSTDSYVVNPIFFKGGDIGRLAVCGTVNDLAVQGAAPKFLSAAVILEEGFEIKLLEQIVESMAQACEEAGVSIVTGDTKVVEKGKCDALYINTAGIGVIKEGIKTSSDNAQGGDIVIVSGFLGEHGIAVLNGRHKLGIESDIKSDAAPLNKITLKLLEELGPDIHVMRDLTRGGLTAALNDIAKDSGVIIEMEEKNIPVSKEVKSVSGILGLNFLNIANEGKIVCLVPEAKAAKALEIIKGLPYGENAAVCGRAHKDAKPQVLLTTALGAKVVMRNSSSQELPRIC